MAQLQLTWLFPSSFALTETVLCLEKYNDVAKDWCVCSIISYTHSNKGYKKVFRIITKKLSLFLVFQHLQDRDKWENYLLLTKYWWTKILSNIYSVSIQLKKRECMLENEKCCGKKTDSAVSTVCPVLTNFHECFSNSIATRIALRTRFLYIHLYKNRLHVLSLGCAHMEERAWLSRDSFWFLFTPAFCVTCITTIFRHAM